MSSLPMETASEVDCCAFNPQSDATKITPAAISGVNMTRRLPRAGTKGGSFFRRAVHGMLLLLQQTEKTVFKTVVSDCESERLLKTQDLLPSAIVCLGGRRSTQL